MNKNRVLRLTVSAAFAAIILIATALFPIALPSGYANLGDCFVILAGMTLGPVYGALAAGIGAGLSDLFLGYGIYVPATFVIKALMAICACAVTRAFAKRRAQSLVRIIVASVCAELVMIACYFAFEAVFVYGGMGAAVNMIGNAVQGAVGIAGASVLSLVCEKNGIISRIWQSN